MRKVYKCLWTVLGLFGLLVSFGKASHSQTLVDIPCSYAFNRISCSDNELRMISNGNTLKTIDRFGDEHFNRIPSSGINAVFFLDSNVGWVVGDSGKIFRTSNNGRDWRISRSGVKTRLMAIYCVGDSCWVVGEKGQVLKKNDSRNGWAKLETISDENLNALYFVNEMTGWVVGSGATILKTINGGLTWDAQTRIQGIDRSHKSDYEYNFVDVQFIDENIGYVATESGVARTDDGGKKWIYQTLPGSFMGVVPKSKDEVVLIGNDRSTNLCSNNGGGNWKKCE